jgi:hypothetical protein
MSKTKKLDIFNLFYSGAAVVILIGVIAKLLEWPAQDLLITGGLAIEAVVFGVSAVKFVEVAEKQEVATEATLSKVAEGLGQIASNGAGIGGAVAGDTYVNIQTGTMDGTASANSNTNTNVGASVNSITSAPDRKVAIEINAPSNPSVNTSHTLWQLEQMDILSLAKDLFFQPKWDELLSDEYNQLSIFFKRVFDKKLPNKEALPFLLQFPVKLPVPELNKLSIDKVHIIDTNDIELLCKAFKLINYNSFFEGYILESKEETYTIRPKKSSDVQVYGGEDEIVLAHLNKYYSSELIVSPDIECIQSSIRLKGQLLLEYFIQKVDVKNEEELNSLIGLLDNQSDELKLKLWTKFKKIRYNHVTNDGYSYLKVLIQSSISFVNSNNGVQLFNRLIEFQVSDKKTINLQDVVNYSTETIYFGPKNEYSVNLKELFLNGELENLGYINTIIEKLVSDNVAPKSKLVQLFNLSEHDSKKEVFDKLNYHLTKTNTSPSGAQLAFVLLYKQYSNS